MVSEGETRDLDIEVIRTGLLKIAFSHNSMCGFCFSCLSLNLNDPIMALGPLKTSSWWNKNFVTSKIENHYSAQRTGNEALAIWKLDSFWAGETTGKLKKNTWKIYSAAYLWLIDAKMFAEFLTFVDTDYYNHIHNLCPSNLSTILLFYYWNQFFSQTTHPNQFPFPPCLPVSVPPPLPPSTSFSFPIWKELHPRDKRPNMTKQIQHDRTKSLTPKLNTAIKQEEKSTKVLARVRVISAPIVRNSTKTPN